MLCVRVAITLSPPLRQDGAIATLEMTQMTQLFPKKSASRRTWRQLNTGPKMILTVNRKSPRPSAQIRSRKFGGPQRGVLAFP
ncbi:uncharacterized [Tachysurus ichikawai]